MLKGKYDLSNIVSFNVIKPLPSELKDVAHDNLASDVERMLGDVPTFLSERPTLNQIFEKYNDDKLHYRINKLLLNRVNHGAVSWYQWCVKNWGTKWDMYDYSCKDNVLVFNTAWSAPIKLYHHLSKTLPDDVTLSFEYASEDVAQYSGIGYISNKSVVLEEHEKDSDEAWQLTIDLLSLEDDVEYVDGKWQYKDN